MKGKSIRKKLSVCIFVFIFLMVSIISGSFFTESAMAATLLADDFESYSTFPSGGWTTYASTGSWTILTDGTKVAKSNVSSTGTYLLINGDSAWANYSYSAKVKPGTIGTRHGLAFRFNDENNYYYFVLKDGRKANLYKNVNGSETAILSANYKYDSSSFYNMKVEISGAAINCFVNDVQVLSGTDNSLSTGKAGLYTFGNASFDDVLVSDYAAPTPTPTPSPTPAPSTNPYGAGLDGHVVPGPNPVTGRTISVLDYGANIADNNTDDRPAIEAALSAAVAGDEIYFPDGVYNLLTSWSNDTYTNIKTKSGVNLRGQSQSGTILRTSLDSGSGTTAYSILKIRNINNVLVSNMTLTSTWNGNYSTDPVVVNPDAGGPLYPIHIEALSKVPSYNITIDSVTIEKYKRIAIRVAQCHDVVVKNCLIKNATDVSGSGAGYGIVFQGEAAGINNYGLQNDSLYNIAENNTIEGPYIRHGVLLQYYTHNNAVRNNTCINTVYDAIDLHGEDEYKNEIYGNTCRDIAIGGAVGVGNSGSTHDAAGAFNYIHDNTVINCETGVEVLYGSPDTIIENNSITGSTIANGFGIKVLNGPRTIIKGNYINSNLSSGYWGIYLAHDVGTAGNGVGDPEDVQIINNTVTYNTKGVGIYAGTGELLSGNIISNNVEVDYYHY